jgi:hypothetical protein
VEGTGGTFGGPEGACAREEEGVARRLCMVVGEPVRTATVVPTARPDAEALLSAATQKEQTHPWEARTAKRIVVASRPHG